MQAAIERALRGAMRRLVLGIAGQPAVQDLATRDGLGGSIASRFVAGETADDAIRVIRNLNARGLLATADYLGEHCAAWRDAEAAVATYVDVLARIEEERLDANVSLKLTQLGLDLDEARCEEALERVVTAADGRGNFVGVDMEGSAYTERTLAMFGRVHAQHPDAVGAVIQAYLYRSAADVRSLVRMGAQVRLCKGAYAEPPSIAYADRAEVDRNFVRLAEILLALGRYPAIATHDPAMITHARKFSQTWSIDRDRFEFQMLYGIRRDLQQELRDAGYRVRVYIPFGTAWYPYLTRRLAERPANLIFIAGSIAREALAGTREARHAS
jgi:proline dehydrogenase